MQQKPKKITGIVISIVTCLVLIVVVSILIINRQYVIDQLTVWQFKPTGEVVALADRSGLNDNGKFIFFASKPKLYSSNDSAAFNNACDRLEVTTAILGCYSNSQIYVYDVSNKKLDGIREVTAMHETMHAIYDRMSEEDKTATDQLIEAEYSKLVHEKDFSDIMAFYARTEPGQRDNELHSIIGTEISVLSSALEAHYDKYFSDRQKVVKLNANYSSVFKSLKSHADTLSAQMDELKASVTAKSEQYNTSAHQLSSDISSFNTRATNGDFTSQWQFNNERSILVARSTELSAMRESISTDIATYEAMLKEYNLLATESKQLYNSIDSTLSPAPSM